MKPETVEQLIKHLITEPPIELEEKIRFKKAHVTCGLFSHHFNKVENVIVSNEHLMNQLLQFLEQPSPLHPLLASFFSKAITCCLQKFQSQTLKLFQKRNNFFDLLVNHVDTSAIMDFIDSFFTITRQTEIDKMDENWINSSDISNKLLNVFTIERSIESHENAAYILFRLIEIYRNPQFLDDSDRFTILNVLESKVFIDLFLNKILANPTPSLVTNGMNVILSLVDYQKHLRIMTNQLEAKPASGQDLCAKKESDHSIRFFDCVYNVHEAILSRLHLLKNLLINPIETNPIELTTGIIEKPFGITRLKILSLLRSILTVNNPKFNTAIKDNQIFPLLIVSYSETLSFQTSTQIDR